VKRESLLGRLAIFAVAMVLVLSFGALTAYAADGGEPRMTTGPQIMKKATPATATEPIHNPAGSHMLVARLTTIPTCDGNIDPAEWSDAYMYDVSDTTGQEDGLPDPLGTVYLWLKQDDNGIYFAIRNNADQTLDDYDQVGLYFDDNYDGCFPASATNEGNNWLVWSATGPYVQWRYSQDLDCGFPPTYNCQAEIFGGNIVWAPSCFGIGIGPTGVVDYEAMIPYGTLDQYLDLTMPPDSLGFFMFCQNAGASVINGSWPNQSYGNTFQQACYYGYLVCEGQQEWPDHKMHFPQLPDLIGWDVNATSPIVLADDWQCSQTGPVTDIHFWGSWKDMDGDPVTDDVGQIQFFQFGIYSNLPVGDPQNPFPYSIPGQLLWSMEEWLPGTPTEPPTLEAWYDPWTGSVIPNDHVPYWQYDFVDIPQPFYQDSGAIYWLSISAVLVDPQNFVWGWKNSRDHFEDDAVFMSPTGEWVEMYEPPRSNRFSVYFDGAGVPSDQGSTNYYGQGWYYYGMTSWWNMWFYDNPFTYEHSKEINLDMMIDPVGPSPIVQFAINWSTDLWSMEGEPGRPPLPEDEFVNPGYIGRQEFEVYPGDNPIYFTLPYNPEWVSVDFRGQDVIINGMINHECVQTSMDLAFVITGQEQEPDLDFGDAPDPNYPTLLASDGARHQIVPGIFLGASIDAETDGQPDPNALGDDNNGIDDEDGVVFTSLLMPGYQAKVKITASVAAPIDAWIDFNADGDWNDAGEQIFNSVTLSAGANNLNFGVPSTAVPGVTMSRFRFSTMGGLGVTGLAPDGEVEDHQVTIVEPIGDIKMDYPQLPDLEGWDVLATSPLILADDWLCTETGPVTDLHFWGSWINDLVAPINGFWVSIHSDIPGPPYSQPGPELWSEYITDFHEQPVGTGEQGWFDPYGQFWERPNHFTCFQYDITNIPDPFIQEEGTIYWLNIRADVPGASYPVPPLWGWKTSIQHFADDATWSTAEPPYQWIPLTDPQTGITLDLAFVITGAGQPVLCGDVNNDGVVNVGDAIYILNYLFKHGGAPMPYLCVGDVNNDDVVNVGDAIYILNYLFKHGGAPDPNCCNPPWVVE
jgi:hypothetical protein